MLRTHKIRLNPTTEQVTYFKQASGIARFTYNWMLGQWKDSRKDGREKKTIGQLKADLNHRKAKEFPWMYAVTKCAVEYAILDLQKAFKNHYKNKKHFKFPVFKSKKRSPMKFGVDNCNFNIINDYLYLPNMDKPINLTEKIRFNGRFMVCRISYHAGHWYAAVTVDVPQTLPALILESGERPTQEKTLGIDLGLKTLATLSNHQEFENQKFLKAAQRKVKRLQRQVSRSQTGGKNCEKVVLRLEKAHERVADLRGDYYHKTVNEILGMGLNLIGVENLNVTGMMKNHKMAGGFGDAALGEFIRILQYKAAFRGIRVVEVSRFYPSSQLCHACQYQNKELTLDQREWDCPKCGAHHDRDFNASENIRDEALRIVLNDLVSVQT